MADKKKYWIQSAVKHPGALHKTAKIKKGSKIPVSKLRSLLHSKNVTTRRRAQFAMNMKKIRERRMKRSA